MSHVHNDHKATLDQVENQHDGASFSNPAPSSLFPAYAAPGMQQATGWLQNASFPAMPATKQTEAGTADQAARSKLEVLATSCPNLPQVQHDPKSLLPASGLRLQQAAEQLLPFSSSDSEADATDGQKPLEVPIPPRGAAQAADLDSGSDEASHRKLKRRLESAKHKKHKKHRSASTSPPSPASTFGHVLHCINIKGSCTVGCISCGSVQ